MDPFENHAQTSTKSKVPCIPNGKEPPPPRIMGVRGTQEAREPIRGSRTFLHSVRQAVPRPRRMRQGRIIYSKGPTSTNMEIQECFHRVRPLYMARTNYMMYGDRSMESVLKIKTQPHHTFLIRLALTTILPPIDQNTYPFEEFVPSYFQTSQILKNNGFVPQINNNASLNQLGLPTFPISILNN